MKIFTNRDIKKFFLLISCILGGFLLFLQLAVYLSYGTWKFSIFILSFVFALCILVTCFLYFCRQTQIMEDAVSKINLYLSGDTNVRIECEMEGSLYRLFHAVNTLASVLNAHAVKEQKVKEFLRGTISDISHQLKTPLAALTIYNGLLQEEPENIEAVKEFAAKSGREMERIEMLVQNLLKITKLDAGLIPIRKKPENITALMNEVYQYFEFRANEENKIFTLSGPGHIRLFCDRDWMIEAVSNIVKNALDHTGPRERIEIVWKQLPTVIQIEIRDSGSGIHPEDIHHIFKRFYRSRFSKDTQGIGLGLPLSKAIAEAHEGTVTVDSGLGKGSTFIFKFPNLTKM